MRRVNGAMVAGCVIAWSAGAHAADRATWAMTTAEGWALDGWSQSTELIRLAKDVASPAEATATMPGVLDATGWAVPTITSQLSFDRPGDEPLVTRFYVEASGDGGSTWQRLHQHTPNHTDGTAETCTATVPTDLLTASFTVRFVVDGPPSERPAWDLEVRDVQIADAPVGLFDVGLNSVTRGQTVDLAWAVDPAATLTSLAVTACCSPGATSVASGLSPEARSVSWTPGVSTGAGWVEVVANLSNGGTATSRRTVIVESGPPSSFNLGGPSSGSKVGPTVSLSWYPSAPTSGEGAVYYDLVVDAQVQVRDIFQRRGPGYLTYRVPPEHGLTEGRHDWWIVARDRAGNSRIAASRWVEVDATPPSAFDLLTPADGGWIGPSTAISWAEPTPDVASSFRVVVDGEPCDWTATTWTTLADDCEDLDLPDEGTIHWWVEARDAYGNLRRGGPEGGRAAQLDGFAPGLRDRWTGWVRADDIASANYATEQVTDLTATTGEEIRAHLPDPTDRWCFDNTGSCSSLCYGAAGSGSFTDARPVPQCSFGSLLLGVRPNTGPETWGCWSRSEGVLAAQDGKIILAANDNDQLNCGLSLSVVVEVGAPWPRLAGEGTTNERRPTFSWTALTDTLSGLDRYEVILDPATTIPPGGDSTLPFLWCETTGTTCTGEFDLPDDRYTGVLRAVDNAGNARVQEFTLQIDTTPPDAFDLVARDTCDASLTPTLCWDTTRDTFPGKLVETEIWADGDVLVDDIQPTTGFTQCEVVVLPRGAHTWWVVAVDAAGNRTRSSSTADLSIGANPEICNGLNDDCFGGLPLDERDLDDDGVMACEGDFDDNDPTSFPGAPEICDGIDNDGDGSLPLDEMDADADGFLACTTCPGLEGGAGIDRDLLGCGDCDDGDPKVSPSATEVCSDGVDDDCDGELLSTEHDRDADGVYACDDDPDDDDPTTYPGAPELCDGVDNDGDGTIPADEADADEDDVRVCDGDTVDDDPTVHPGAPELCDGLDNDLDGTVPADEADADSDGIAACEGDCDDGDPERRPGAPERCNGLDDDCDPATPEPCDTASTDSGRPDDTAPDSGDDTARDTTDARGGTNEDPTGCTCSTSAGRPGLTWLLPLLTVLLGLRRRHPKPPTPAASPGAESHPPSRRARSWAAQGVS
ncbi:MAG: putative metal-binding motif-containing protein [Alphaproteobacteria bacterium]|nr:putative metal-binding motif-containing protein [Alphaproteobacteria bacterium]